LSGGCQSAGTRPMPSLPSSFLLPSSPPTVLGGSAFFLLIHQKQETHGTQSMGFEAIHQPKSRCAFLL
jgi:hypothetical protein